MSNSEMPKSAPDKKKKLSPQIIVIIVLAILVAISAGALATRYIYLNFFDNSKATVTIEDNLIGDNNNQDAESNQNADTDQSADTNPENDSQQAVGENNNTSDLSDSGQGNTDKTKTETEKPKATVIELFKGQPEDNETFNVTNMLPGDIVTKYFCVKATHDSDFNLLFAAQITNQTKQLANALNIRISIPETDTVLYDGTFAQADKQELCKTVLKNDQGQTIIYYKIDVYMDTSVGNEYQAASLTADFDWYVNEQDSLTSPDTGDNLNIILWSVLLLSSAAIMLLLLLKSRKEENKR